MLVNHIRETLKNRNFFKLNHLFASESKFGTKLQAIKFSFARQNQKIRLNFYLPDWACIWSMINDPTFTVNSLLTRAPGLPDTNAGLVKFQELHVLGWSKVIVLK